MSIDIIYNRFTTVNIYSEYSCRAADRISANLKTLISEYEYCQNADRSSVFDFHVHKTASLV